MPILPLYTIFSKIPSTLTLIWYTRNYWSRHSRPRLLRTAGSIPGFPPYLDTLRLGRETQDCHVLPKPRQPAY